MQGSTQLLIELWQRISDFQLQGWCCIRQLPPKKTEGNGLSPLLRQADLSQEIIKPRPHCPSISSDGNFKKISFVKFQLCKTAISFPSDTCWKSWGWGGRIVLTHTAHLMGIYRIMRAAADTHLGGTLIAYVKALMMNYQKQNQRMNAWLQIWKCNISQGEHQSCSLYCNPADRMQMCMAQQCTAQSSLSVFSKQEAEEAACHGANSGIQGAWRFLSLACLQPEIDGTRLNLISPITPVILRKSSPQLYQMRMALLQSYIGFRHPAWDWCE